MLITTLRDGNNGPWSSFGMQIGTPPQSIRLIPSTSGNALWPVLPQGCIAGDPSNCADLRGRHFRPNESSTWSDLGLYKLGLIVEGLLGYSGNANFGYDTVTLGWPGDGLPTLNHQVIQGLATKDFYVGSLGLSPRAINLTNFNNPQPSMLRTLQNDSKIPSSSWDYTAGAYYQQPRVFGSLTLGGYDSARFVSNNLTISFGADISRDLLIGIQSITSDTTSSPLLPKRIYAFIDSLVPHIWLPLEACRAFEKAFGLTWNDTAELYLLTEDMHNRLVAQNANITFTLGPSSTGGDTVDIIMPYGSFDLTASAPLVDHPTRYFPLKRAQNDTQYILGRTFLQQAYVIADYDRSNFSVSQALFPPTSVAQKIVPILPPGEAPPTNSQSLSKSAIAGIIVAVIACIILALLAIFLILRRRSKQRAAAEQDPHHNKSELDAPDTTKTELDTSEKAKIELEAMGTPKIELDTSDTRRYKIGRAELPGQDPAAHELPA